MYDYLSIMLLICFPNQDLTITIAIGDISDYWSLMISQYTIYTYAKNITKDGITWKHCRIVLNGTGQNS